MYTIITFNLHGIFPSPYFGDIVLFLFPQRSACKVLYCCCYYFFTFLFF